MPDINKIFELINKVIDEKDKLKELQKLTKKFFKGKEQKDFEEIDFKKLSSLKNCYDIIMKNKLSEIDKAKLDLFVNKPLRKYLAIDYYGKLSEDKLKELAKKISFYDILKTKKDFTKHRDFMAWIGEGLATGDFFEYEDENYNNDFYINIFVLEEEWNILILGTKKYKVLFEELNKILN